MGFLELLPQRMIFPKECDIMNNIYIDPDLETWIANLPPHISGEVQTRSEVTGLMQHKTLDEAIIRIRQDAFVWKVSYTTEDGWRRMTVPG